MSTISENLWEVKILLVSGSLVTSTRPENHENDGFSMFSSRKNEKLLVQKKSSISCFLGVLIPYSRFSRIDQMDLEHCSARAFLLNFRFISNFP